jgi:Family of unknown function (DUF6600)
MRCRLSKRGTWGLALVVLWAALGISQADDADPPGRVARLSDAEGSVSLQPAGVQEWTAATLNRPITTGDRLWSDQSSRAELDLGTVALRLGSNTGFAFLNLDDHGAQMQLSAGALIVSVRDLPGGESYEVDTPNIALVVQQPGVYRVDVNDAGTATAVAVSQGAAQAAGGGQTIDIAAQQSVIFNGVDPPGWQSSSLGAPDEFDSWSAERERELAESASAGYVPNDIPGAQDLDSNGQWQQAPEYGYVWVPTAVAVGWVPYRYGHWVWITPWGWTWVDGAPWGYAPFHYGRWVVWKNNWSWVPAPRHGPHERAVYAPALVAWVGRTAPRAGAFGAVGWFPLGPREVYVPAYRASPTYVRNVNITNTTVVDNTYLTNVYQSNATPQHYVNDTARAVTIVSRNTFTSGRSVGARAIELPPAVVAAAAVTAAAPAIVPIRQSVLGPGEGRAVPRPPAGLLQRPVVARTAPPPAPAPFERQLSAIQANGRPLTRSELAPLQPASPIAPVRVVSSRGAPVPAGVAAHGSGAPRATNTAPPSPRTAARTRGATTPSLAARERALQQSILPSSPPGAHTAQKPPANTSLYSPATAEPTYPMPALRSDRPPSVQQPHSVASQRAYTPEDPTHASERPASLPVYHFPSGGEAPAHPPAAVHQEETHRAAPPPPPPHTSTASPPAAHPSPPTHAQSSKEPRDLAPHGDRDSRERVLR